MTTLPPERDLPTAARKAARASAVAAVSRRPGRAWGLRPLAAAAALVAVVGGAAVAGDRLTAGNRPPAASPANTASTASASPTPPPPPRTVAPPTAADRRRCQVADSDRYVTGYRDAEATTWLFLRAAAKETSVCTTLAGQDARTANFMNDWFGDGLAPAPAGQLSATVDEMGALGSDWRVLVGAVPASTRRVVVEGPDGEQRAALAASWYVFHFHERSETRSVYAYDADDLVIASVHLS